ncbi:hypothetical protein AKJ16_DCAP02490 [Drosera capensis]
MAFLKRCDFSVVLDEILRNGFRTSTTTMKLQEISNVLAMKMHLSPENFITNYQYQNHPTTWSRFTFEAKSTFKAMPYKHSKAISRCLKRSLALCRFRGRDHNKESIPDASKIHQATCPAQIFKLSFRQEKAAAGILCKVLQDGKAGISVNKGYPRT